MTVTHSDLVSSAAKWLARKCCVVIKEHPILFSGEMVRAILDGRKTQTRRVVKPQPKGWSDFWPVGSHTEWQDIVARLPFYLGCGYCPYGAPGDRLWVRESFQPLRSGDEPGDWETGAGYSIKYAATDQLVEWVDYWNDNRITDRCMPSIHMPRWASRITLEIVAVGVERLQKITKADAIAEGSTSVEAFEALWDRMNARRGLGWHTTNPWVWVLTFKRLESCLQRGSQLSLGLRA